MPNELSKERAIEALYTVRAYYASLTAGYPKGKDCRGIGDVMCSEIANSCLMAIKALEQIELNPSYNGVKTELEPCEDCVSREQALDAMDTWDKFGYTEKGSVVRIPKMKGDYVPYVRYDDMVKCIKNLPSVKPQRPKGEWIEQNDTSKHHFGWYYCSNCGSYLMSADGANYCSYCGSLNGGETDGNE